MSSSLSVWEAVQGNVPGTMTTASMASDALNTQLASALSTMGDAQFWEETISPATIRTSLQNSDPSNPNSTPALLKGMKWLLASISKGRDVSDFYPHVVKLVGAKSLEVRKMVYMYLVQYADHDATTRELSLLSINSFQRGLADHEQLIRGLALRVLSSIRIPDILQIQILGVQKCSKDQSPYVRKCAANALAKLNPRCDTMQREMLLDLLREWLDHDSSTMVLTSSLVAFQELCPSKLELLHTSVRKICHLLTDMDEWGQVVVLDLLARYCRRFFKEPRAWKHGTAERIDRERRVHRTVQGVVAVNVDADTATATSAGGAGEASLLAEQSESAPAPAPKRRVVKKGFYSDEEDNSTEEDDAPTPTNPMGGRNILGLPGMPTPVIHMNAEADEDGELDVDHKLVLQSSTPLLKSRNAGVVLAVCSLHYYCGVSSVKSRSAIGKALVRIHRDRREIQYVVLTSIRTLVNECPSAFAPFLNDFFVKAMDPPFTRLIKIDILTSLALEPAAIEAVLKELRTCIRHTDKVFVCAAIRAVGKVAELARIVYDRHGTKSGHAAKERKTANRIGLDCLYGLSVITQSCDNQVVVGECVTVMQNIMLMLMSDAGDHAGLKALEDPNDVQGFALRRIMLLLVQTLSLRTKEPEEEDDENDSDDEGPEESALDKISIELPPGAVSSALWLVGEWLSMLSISPVTLPNVDGTVRSKMRVEIARLVDRAFPDLDPLEKEQGTHFASKLLISSASGAAPVSVPENAICEHILSMGRVDVNPDVRDRARYESGVLQATIGLKHDTDATESLPALGSEMTIENAKRIFLLTKPAPSYLPVEDNETVDTNSFRFGTLSSLVGHKARGAYLDLPPWGESNSPKALRDPIEAVKEQVGSGWKSQQQSASGFYEGEGASSSDSDSDSDSDDSSSSDSSSSEDGDQQNSGSDGDNDGSSNDDDSSSDASNGNLMNSAVRAGAVMPPMNGGQHNFFSGQTMQPLAPMPALQQVQIPSQLSSESSSSDDSSSSSSDSSDSDAAPASGNSGSGIPGATEGNLLSMGGGSGGGGDTLLSQHNAFGPSVSTVSNDSSSALDDLRGLVMAPVAVEDTAASDPDFDRDSSAWIQLVRPELCGGLAVKARYLRGPTKTREAQLKGLDPNSPSVVCLQIHFVNKKPDSGSLRRIRILQRSGPSGAVATKKIVCPPEIPELKKGQMSTATLCIEFVSASNRDGDLVARLEIKSAAGGGTPVQIKPTLSELLRPCKRQKEEFDTQMAQMQGFERVESTFTTPSYALVPQWIIKQTALSFVGSKAWKEGKLRLVGGLPASNDNDELLLVHVLIECDKASGVGKIIVCCDHAVAVNSILNDLKRAVSSPPPDV